LGDLRRIAGELGYADYLGALERYRLEDLHDPRVSSKCPAGFDYPFADRLYPDALNAVKRVFQPRKVERSGLWKAFDGNVLIYIHKEEELDDVERMYPAKHYVLIDDKLRILAAVKAIWGTGSPPSFRGRAISQTIKKHSPNTLGLTFRSRGSAISPNSTAPRSRQIGILEFGHDLLTSGTHGNEAPNTRAVVSPLPRQRILVARWRSR
jgi:hypothetical protein